MCQLLNFLIIDEFKTKRQGSIYFLTHWHSDHYDGISNKWQYGPIFCSAITKKLLLTKYPKLIDKVFQLKYHQENIIQQLVTNFTQIKETIHFTARIFDSNHMAGSIMILIQIQGKYYLHTGDMRFNSTVAEKLPDLFQKSANDIDKNIIEYQCKYEIQKLYLDNTFCDPIFMFPPRSFALKLITKIISQYKPSRLFLCTDSIGKQQAFVYLSQKYNCKVKINKDRKRYIKCMGIDYKKHFTDKEEQDVWIEVIRKNERESKVSQIINSISITLTGWANLNDYHPIGYNSFVVPYSLHSNYQQIELFVKSIRPKMIIPIVSHKQQKQSDTFRQKIGSYESYMMSLCFIKQRGLQYLRKTYQKIDQILNQSDEKNIENPLTKIEAFEI